MNLDYNDLTSLERQLFTEDQMGDRINLSYRSALKEFYSCKNTNEKISMAFDNFMKYKNDPFNVLPQTDTLLYAGVDKFKKELTFVIKNGENDKLSLYLFNIDTKVNRLITDQMTGDIGDETAYFHTEYVNNLNDPKVRFASFEWCPEMEQNIEDIWNNAVLTHFIDNVEYNLDIPSFENQPYSNDDDYQKINKKFSSIMSEENSIEINQHDHNYLMSEFNPAHTTLLPNDILHMKTSLIKNANSSI